jgi:hypothetical protein
MRMFSGGVRATMAGLESGEHRWGFRARILDQDLTLELEGKVQAL